MRLMFFRSVVAFCFLSFGLNVLCNAQYLERRKNYGQQEYKYQAGDPHPPLIAALGAAVLPGLGHFIAGEPLRGLGFAAGYYGGIVVSVIGAINLMEYPNQLQYVQIRNHNKALLYTGAVTATLFYFYGILDAREVAKINNLAYRDNYRRLSFQFQPGRGSAAGQNYSSIGFSYALKL